ncbi:MAG: UDP-N-acetylmuramate--L-alanine ligase [Prevotellaceae bacterium]|jgi:UDP-N-acetylmuramate--alanine ligase|nr:UDP-N-acetylmuramate--L-alanine ligase [Prevotellaceae bacterium]
MTTKYTLHNTATATDTRALWRPASAVYFIGVGGAGMSALAKYCRYLGATVAGYDRTPSALTKELEDVGVAIHYDDDTALIPPAFLPTPDAAGLPAPPPDTLIVYTPAVPANHRELSFFRQQGYHIVKRARLLGEIAAGKATLAVAGAHGKTTISAMIAHLLRQTGMGCSAFLGGRPKNYHSHLMMAPSPALVVEADEFDRSFLQLFPLIAVVTSVDADHLDVYGTAAAVKRAYGDFIRQIRLGGTLILKQGVDLSIGRRKQLDVRRYALDQACDFYASNIRRLDSGLLRFDLHLPDGTLTNCTLGVAARTNVENAVAAVAAVWSYWQAYRLPPDFAGSVRRALASFRGVQRRFDVQVNTPTRTYIDDYAHHPEELRATIASLRETFPGRKITGVFQPHLYSRTRDFAAAFAESLSGLDELILLDIYPAREAPLPGVTSQLIFDRVALSQKQRCAAEDLLNLLRTKNVEVLVTFGAGDIDRLVQPIADWMNAAAAANNVDQ